MFRNQIATITDTNSYQFSDTNDIINSLIGGAPTAVKNNAHILVILLLIGVLYAIVNHKDTPDNVINIIDNPIVKISTMGVIILMSKTSPLAAIAAIIVFCLTIQSLQQKKKPSIVDVEEEEIDNQLDEIVSDAIDNDINAANVEFDNSNFDSTEQNINTDIDDNINTIGVDINATADNAGAGINAVGDNVGEDINAVVDNVGADINAVGDNIGADINAMVDNVGQDVNSAIDNGGFDINSTVNNDETDVNAIVNNDRLNINSALNNVDSSVRGQFNNLKNTVGDIKDDWFGKKNQAISNNNIEPFGSSDIDNFEKIN